MWIQVVGAFLAIFAFSIIIEVPKKYCGFAAFVGGFGWFIYLLASKWRGSLWGTFLATVCIAIIAHILARVLKSPVIVFLIPGILTLVPGAGMYKSAYQLFLGSSLLASQYFIETIELAGMIALAIFLVDSLINLVPRPTGIQKHNVFRKKTSTRKQNSENPPN